MVVVTVDDAERIAFLEERLTGVGSGDIAALAGLSEYGSPWSVWTKKMRLSPLDDEPTEAMRFGCQFLRPCCR